MSPIKINRHALPGKENFTIQLEAIYNLKVVASLKQDTMSYLFIVLTIILIPEHGSQIQLTRSANLEICQTQFKRERKKPIIKNIGQYVSVS